MLMACSLTLSIWRFQNDRKKFKANVVGSRY